MDLDKIFRESYYPHILDELPKKTFDQFLVEVNYGSLESDIRINDITEQLKYDMIHYVNNYQLYGTVPIMIVPKSKNPIGKHYNILWTFKVYVTKNPVTFADGANITIQGNTANITIIIFMDKNKSDEEFVEQLITFIKSGNINEYLRHEVRHFLDKVDNKFQEDKYHSIDNINTATEYEKTKYVSQHNEIESWLISVLSNLEYIYHKIKTNTTSPTFEQVSHLSKPYNDFMRFLIPSKRSKYKTKILHYWYEKGFNK